MNAVDVLHLHRWNSHTSTSNINMCCIGYLGKEGERGGKRVHLWFLKADNDVDVQSAVWHWMRSNRRIQSSFFFWKRSLGSYFFSHMCLSIFCLIWLFFNLWHLNWSKSIKNDQKMSWRRILRRHVRSFYSLTYIFHTIRDCTHDNNAAIFGCLSVWTKKDTHREGKNVKTLLNFYFFIFENHDRTTSDLQGAIVECLKCYNGPLFSARFENIHTITTSQSLSEWFEETKKLEGSASRWGSRIQKNFLQNQKLFFEKNLLSKTSKISPKFHLNFTYCHRFVS